VPKLLVPSPDDFRVLRYVCVGEPSPAKILLWDTMTSIDRYSRRPLLAFAFWPAGERQPLFVNAELVTMWHDSDSDENLAAVLGYVVSGNQGYVNDEQRGWLLSAEAHALALDLDVAEENGALDVLFRTIGG
jgi:hypothetical protein